MSWSDGRVTKGHIVSSASYATLLLFSISGSYLICQREVCRWSRWLSSCTIISPYGELPGWDPQLSQDKQHYRLGSLWIDTMLWHNLGVSSILWKKTWGNNSLREIGLPALWRTLINGNPGTASSTKLSLAITASCFPLATRVLDDTSRVPLNSIWYITRGGVTNCVVALTAGKL